MDDIRALPAPTRPTAVPSGRSPAAIAVVALLAVAALLQGCGRQKAPLVTRPPGGEESVVIRNVRVFDAPHAALLAGLHDVVVRDGRIAAVAAPGAAAEGVPAIDGQGGTLLPGLVDVHTHTGSSADRLDHVSLPDLDANLAAYLYAGITTVLDLGSLSPDVFRARTDVATGKRLGPHMYAAGPIFTAPGGHPVEVLRAFLPWYLRWYVIPRAAREIGAPDDGRAAVRALLAERPDILKLAIDAGAGGVPCLTPEATAAIVETGHKAGVRSIAHIGSNAEAEMAVRAGVDALAHAPWRDELSDDVVRLIVDRHVAVVPTLSIWDLVAADRVSADDFLPIERTVAGTALMTSLLTPDANQDPDLLAVRRAAAAGHAARQRNVAKLRAAGATILVGSDACNAGDIPGGTFHLELAKLVAAGLPPGEALRDATWTNARFLAGDGADFGEIAAGKRADLLLVAGDPTARIEDLQRISEVVLEGMVLVRRTKP
ncbi:MAG TPA: amidohydrolase family protein [Candidatus Binatia bacterium]|jgi:imidazolonepropionase-like amidohydrolase